MVSNQSKALFRLYYFSFSRRNYDYFIRMKSRRFGGSAKDFYRSCYVAGEETIKGQNADSRLSSVSAATNRKRDKKYSG